MSKRVVVDTSIVVKWVLAEADSHQAVNLLQEWLRREVVILAPTLLIYEVANVLYQQNRKGKLTLQETQGLLGHVLFSLKLDFGFSQDRDLTQRAIELACCFDLPASYDAFYLALAERENCEFWTADTRMLRAIKAKLDWVRCLNDYQPDIS